MRCPMHFARTLRHFALLVVLLAAVPLYAQAPLPELSHSLREVKPRPAARELRLKDMDGKLHDLAEFRGKVVLLNFWATWCPPCRREMPSMERLHQKLKSRPFQVLAVNVGEEVDAIFPFLGALDVQPTFLVLLDLDSKALKAWPVKGLPTTFILDKQGRIAFEAIGGREFTHPEIVAAIERLMKEP